MFDLLQLAEPRTIKIKQALLIYEYYQYSALLQCCCILFLLFQMHSCPPSCLCRSEESRKIDGIDLSSLEVVEINSLFSGSHEQMELVELLSSNAGVLKRLLINDGFCPRPKEVREKVRSMCHPNVKVDFFVLREGRQVLLD